MNAVMIDKCRAVSMLHTWSGRPSGRKSCTYIPRRFTSARKVKVQNAKIPTARKGISARI